MILTMLDSSGCESNTVLGQLLNFPTPDTGKHLGDPKSNVEFRVGDILEYWNVSARILTRHYCSNVIYLL